MRKENKEDLEMNTQKLIAQSEILISALNKIESIGEHNILIQGETGTGKELVAIYANNCLSRTSNRPLVKINCISLNDELMLDNLFGHKQGAFTDALNDKKGLVECADNGDLFFDEIGELSLKSQKALLGFIDSGEYRRLGDTEIRRSNCRIIATTSQNLDELVEKGMFSENLYRRIAGFTVIVPPLRNRRKDIKPIFEHFVVKNSGGKKQYDSKIMDLFESLNWPGNVRQLESVTKVMCNFAHNDKYIGIEHLPQDYEQMLSDKTGKLKKVMKRIMKYIKAKTQISGNSLRNAFKGNNRDIRYTVLLPWFDFWRGQNLPSPKNAMFPLLFS